MKTQKTSNSQNNLEKDYNWKTRTPWLWIILQSYSNQKRHIFPAIKKEHIWVSPNEMDETWGCYTEWSQKNKCSILTHMYGI